MITEDLCKKSGGQLVGNSCVINTRTSGGEPTLVEIREYDIVAHRVRKPELAVSGKEKGISERQLEEAIFGRPLMTIRKKTSDRGPAIGVVKEFAVDFESGFQRASIFGQTEKDVIKGPVKVEMYRGPDLKGPAWVEWIGLKKDLPVLEEFVR